MNSYRWIIAAIGLMTGTQSYAQDLMGTWIPQPPPGPGARADYALVFKEDNGIITGAIKTPLSEKPLLDLKIDGAKISYKTADDESPPVVWVGELGDDQLRLTVKVGDVQPYKFFYRKVTEAEASALLKLPRNLKVGELPLPDLYVVSDNGLARTPPMGWNSWNKIGAAIDDKTVREIADAMVTSGLRDAGYVYVNIDAGWQDYRDDNGNIVPNVKFPDMKKLAHYVHSKGLKLGIYSSPGPMACAGYIGSHGYEEQDARTFAEWGIDFLEYDWCSAGYYYKTQAEMRAVYQKMGDALQRAGRPILYYVCAYGMHEPGSWARKTGANMWRTAYDIQDTWASMSSNGFEHSGNARDAGQGGWNDPDMLEIGNGGMTTEEYRTHMSLWSILAASLILGNDVRSMTPEIREILLNKEVIAVNQDALGKQGQKAIKRGSTEVWIKPLSDRSVAVALFNRGETETKISIRWADLGITDAHTVRDLWQHKDLGRISDYFEPVVPAHGSIMLRVTPVR